jgi:excisionase family DNA binding protein
MMEKLYTVEQAADMLQVTPRTVRHWLQTKQLKGFMAGRFWRIKESDLQAFLREPETTDEDLDDIAAAEEALAEGGSRPYEEVRRELGL